MRLKSLAVLFVTLGSALNFAQADDSVSAKLFTVIKKSATEGTTDIELANAFRRARVARIEKSEAIKATLQFLKVGSERLSPKTKFEALSLLLASTEGKDELSQEVVNTVQLVIDRGLPGFDASLRAQIQAIEKDRSLRTGTHRKLIVNSRCHSLNSQQIIISPINTPGGLAQRTADCNKWFDCYWKDNQNSENPGQVLPAVSSDFCAACRDLGGASPTQGGDPVVVGNGNQPVTYDNLCSDSPGPGNPIGGGGGGSSSTSSNSSAPPTSSASSTSSISSVTSSSSVSSSSSSSSVSSRSSSNSSNSSTSSEVSCSCKPGVLRNSTGRINIVNIRKAGLGVQTVTPKCGQTFQEPFCKSPTSCKASFKPAKCKKCVSPKRGVPYCQKK